MKIFKITCKIKYQLMWITIRCIKGPKRLLLETWIWRNLHQTYLFNNQYIGKDSLDLNATHLHHPFSTRIQNTTPNNSKTKSIRNCRSKTDFSKIGTNKTFTSPLICRRSRLIWNISRGSSKLKKKNQKS